MQAVVEASYPNSHIGAVVNVDGSGIDDKINSIDLAFTVDKAWFGENNGVSNVKVLHVKDDETIDIETLPATPRDLGDGTYVVTVSGRSFSAFIIIVEPPTAVPTAISTPVRTASPIYFGKFCFAEPTGKCPGMIHEGIGFHYIQILQRCFKNF